MLGRSLKNIPSPPTSPQPFGKPPAKAKLVSPKLPALEKVLLTGVNGYPAGAVKTPFISQLPRSGRATLGPGDGNVQTRLSAKRCRRSNDEVPRSPFRGSEGF